MYNSDPASVQSHGGALGLTGIFPENKKTHLVSMVPTRIPLNPGSHCPVTKLSFLKPHQQQQVTSRTEEACADSFAIRLSRHFGILSSLTINKVREIKIDSNAGLKVGNREQNFNSNLTKEYIQELGGSGTHP